ncbi:hypothetical protein OHD62_34425 [Mesorhizobium sp. YC-39]|uniref:hypothetical protein n=1 Tax=unclassified Mesorhizobium TaxID=325217 RepID=UPI0021E9997A|nr:MULTISPECIES: hypothetical protein [unclassified Mesorhizobium]MCV3211656.1 hypothetical protein [Mesorhizobium sp. YC-2]MCV3233440.1 hypothetical protein [Mesorhizobium sp. YC-39]
MDEVTGDGHAELLDGSIEITFTYRYGHEAILTAIRQTSSTACFCNGPPQVNCPFIVQLPDSCFYTGRCATVVV